MGKITDNHTETGGKMVLGVGRYMRHIPTGRVYPYEVNGAKREDVEIFARDAKGNETKINKPPKKKSEGPFKRDKAVGAFDQPADRVVTQ